jgi:hypothetical protein
VDRSEQAVEGGKVTEHRLDIGILGNVIAEVGHGRGEDWREPDRVDAEGGDVVEPCLDTREIADAVAVRILERSRIDLIDDAALPPGRSRAVSAHGNRDVPSGNGFSQGGMARASCAP